MKARKGRIVAGLAGLVLVVLIGMYWRNLVAWVAFVSLFEGIGLNEQGYPEYRHRQTGIVMVRVPGGVFTMGDPEGQVDNTGVRQERPHQVRLSPFLIAKYETTEAEWAMAMGHAHSQVKRRDYPVTNVSWESCQEFGEKTSLRLPTEAQWEFACRAGTDTAFAFGTTVSQAQAHHGHIHGRPCQIGTFEPNAFGLHDMHGNVSEICEDSFDEHFYSSPEAAEKDPLCKSDTFQDPDRKVRRGGCFYSSAAECRSAARAPVDRDARSIDYDDLGFRAAYYPLP
jgi:formylglycine-generating enzyme required for sulfatase activity